MEKIKQEIVEENKKAESNSTVIIEEEKEVEEENEKTTNSNTKLTKEEEEEKVETNNNDDDVKIEEEEEDRDDEFVDAIEKTINSENNILELDINNFVGEHQIDPNDNAKLNLFTSVILVIQKNNNPLSMTYLNYISLLEFFKGSTNLCCSSSYEIRKNIFALKLISAQKNDVEENIEEEEEKTLEKSINVNAFVNLVADTARLFNIRLNENMILNLLENLYLESCEIESWRKLFEICDRGAISGNTVAKLYANMSFNICGQNINKCEEKFAIAITQCSHSKIFKAGSFDCDTMSSIIFSLKSSKKFLPEENINIENISNLLMLSKKGVLDNDCFNYFHYTLFPDLNVNKDYQLINNKQSTVVTNDFLQNKLLAFSLEGFPLDFKSALMKHYSDNLHEEILINFVTTYLKNKEENEKIPIESLINFFNHYDDELSFAIAKCLLNSFPYKIIIDLCIKLFLPKKQLTTEKFAIVFDELFTKNKTEDVGLYLISQSQIKLISKLLEHFSYLDKPAIILHLLNLSEQLYKDNPQLKIKTFAITYKNMFAKNNFKDLDSYLIPSKLNEANIEFISKLLNYYYENEINSKIKIILHLLDLVTQNLSKNNNKNVNSCIINIIKDIPEEFNIPAKFVILILNRCHDFWNNPYIIFEFIKAHVRTNDIPADLIINAFSLRDSARVFHFIFGNTVNCIDDDFINRLPSSTILFLTQTLLKKSKKRHLITRQNFNNVYKALGNIVEGNLLLFLSNENENNFFYLLSLLETLEPDNFTRACKETCEYLKTPAILNDITNIGDILQYLKIFNRKTNNQEIMELLLNKLTQILSNDIDNKFPVNNYFISCILNLSIEIIPTELKTLLLTKYRDANPDSLVIELLSKYYNNKDENKKITASPFIIFFNNYKGLSHKIITYLLDYVPEEINIELFTKTFIPKQITVENFSEIYDNDLFEKNDKNIKLIASCLISNIKFIPSLLNFYIYKYVEHKSDESNITKIIQNFLQLLTEILSNDENNKIPVNNDFLFFMLKLPPEYISTELKTLLLMKYRDSNPDSKLIINFIITLCRNKEENERISYFMISFLKNCDDDIISQSHLVDFAFKFFPPYITHCLFADILIPRQLIQSALTKVNMGCDFFCDLLNKNTNTDVFSFLCNGNENTFFYLLKLIDDDNLLSFSNEIYSYLTSESVFENKIFWSQISKSSEIQHRILYTVFAHIYFNLLRELPVDSKIISKLFMQLNFKEKSIFRKPTNLNESYKNYSKNYSILSMNLFTMINIIEEKNPQTATFLHNFFTYSLKKNQKKSTNELTSDNNNNNQVSDNELTITNNDQPSATTPEKPSVVQKGKDIQNEQNKKKNEDHNNKQNQNNDIDFSDNNSEVELEEI